MTKTHIKVGMVIRPSNPGREQDEMLVQWVGRDSNRVLAAGYCAKQLSVDGKRQPRPRHSVYSDYRNGEGFRVVKP